MILLDSPWNEQQGPVLTPQPQPRGVPVGGGPLLRRIFATQGCQIKGFAPGCSSA